MMYKHYFVLPLLAVGLVTMSITAYADVYGTATFVTEDGETISSDRIRMDEGNPEGESAWEVKLKQTDSWVMIEYDQLDKLTLTTMDNCRLEKGIVTLKNGESFDLIGADYMTGALFEAEKRSFEVPVADPVNGGETMRDIYCGNVREIIFSENAAGSFRKSEDGRYYPPEYVFDPITGDKMPLVDGVGRTSEPE